MALLALYIAALDAKEMAVAWPVLLAAYELLFHPPKQLGPAAITRWLICQGRLLLVSVPVTAAYIVGRVTGPNRLVSNESYYPAISVRTFMTAWRHYLYAVFYTTVTFNNTKIVILWTAMLAIALLARRRELIFAWIAVVLGALPVIFIPPRGLYAIYLTLPAWYLFLAVCLTLLRDRFVRLVPAVHVRTQQ